MNARSDRNDDTRRSWKSRRLLVPFLKPWGMHLLDFMSRILRFPRIWRSNPYLGPKNVNVSFLPINEDIQLAPDVVLPFQVLKDFVESASHRVIADFCPCRQSLSCGQYPIETGCLYLGKAGLEIHPSLGHEATVEESLAHVTSAIESGLIPAVGPSPAGKYIFGIKNTTRLLSVCFCCECCCVNRSARHAKPSLRGESYVRLEGLYIEVGDDCDGCGICAEQCFMEAVEVRDGRAVIHEGCVGCGRCATVCPRDAIEVKLDNPHFTEEVRTRIESLVDIH